MVFGRNHTGKKFIQSMHHYEFKGATQRMESDIMRMISVHTGKRGDGMKIGLIGVNMGKILSKYKIPGILYELFFNR